jgi:hypothetical protein
MLRKIILLFLVVQVLNMHYVHSQDLSCNAEKTNEIENEIEQLKCKIDSLTKYSMVDTTAKYKILFKEQRGATQLSPFGSWIKNVCLQKYMSADSLKYSQILSGRYILFGSRTNYGNKYLVISYYDYYTGNQTSWWNSGTFYFQKL